MKDQLESRKNLDEVYVDVKMTVIMEVEARWLVSLYDYLLNIPDICSNGFAKAVITLAIANPDNISSLPTTSIVTNPFIDCDTD